MTERRNYYRAAQEEEQGKSVPDRPIQAYLKVIAHDPEAVRRALQARLEPSAR
jgi:hypothetical protein